MVYGHSPDFTRLSHFANNTGEGGGNYVPGPRSSIVAVLIGLLYPIYTMTGFDASAHTSEETKSAQRAVPRGMIASVIISVVFGFVMVSAFVLATPDLVVSAKQGSDAWFNLYQSLPAPAFLKCIIAVGLVLANYLCGLAAATSTSRMIFAFARDEGLPASTLLRRVSPHGAPVYAVWFTCILGFLATPLLSRLQRPRGWIGVVPVCVVCHASGSGPVE